MNSTTYTQLPEWCTDTRWVEFKASEYADWHAYKMCEDYVNNDVYTTTCTTDFSKPGKSFDTFDAEKLCNGYPVEYIELKSRRDSLTPTTFEDFTVEKNKVDSLRKCADALHAKPMIYEIFPKYGIAYVWSVSASGYRTSWKLCPRSTADGNTQKKWKQMVHLPHKYARVVHFPKELWSKMHEKAVEHYSKMIEKEMLKLTNN